MLKYFNFVIGDDAIIRLPIAHLVIGGRNFKQELRLISCITKDRRSILVIFQGSGGIADLLAEAKSLYE